MPSTCRDPAVDAPCDHTAGAKLLERNTGQLLGAPRRDRAVRIMVTMSSEAAHDYSLVRDLLRKGMDCMRINCAHDDPTVWSAMIHHLRKARAACKRDCTILMDLAGPKIRTGAIEPGPAVSKVRPSRDAYGRVTKPARILLSAKQSAGARSAGVDAILCVDDKLLAGLRRGDSIRTARGNSGRNTLDLRSGPLPRYSGDASARIAGEKWYFSRPEITDAATSHRAECVMLNKGPHIIAALRTLDHILQDPHQSEKSSILRTLKLAQDFEKIARTFRRTSKTANSSHPPIHRVPAEC
jgi:hypothetical protein